MFKSAIILFAGLSLFLATGCKVTSSSTSDQKVSAQDEGQWPKIIDQPLTGQIFGKSWLVKAAAVRAISQASDSDVFLDLYADELSDVCSPSFQIQQPFATVTLPGKIEQRDYTFDTEKLLTGGNTGNPLTFVSYSQNNLNVMAEKTKVIVSQFTSTGFDIQLYAQANSTEFGNSEINGVVSVTDCRKRVSFDEWKSFLGTYRVLSFDGQPTSSSNLYSYIENDDSKIYSREKAKYLKGINFNFLTSANTNYSTTLNFGPISEIGESTSTMSGDQLIRTYKYNGPINMDGRDVTLNLIMTTIQYKNKLEVQYDLEVPNIIKRTQHKYQLEKAQ